MECRGLAAITIFTEDLEASRDFYGRRWGLEEAFSDDVSSMYLLGNAYLNVLHVSAAGDLLDVARVGGPDAGVRAQMTVFVEDADEAAAQLRAAGIEIQQGPLDQAWGMRTVSFFDPSGHFWEFGQDLDAP